MQQTTTQIHHLQDPHVLQLLVWHHTQCNTWAWTSITITSTQSAGNLSHSHNHHIHTSSRHIRVSGSIIKQTTTRTHHDRFHIHMHRTRHTTTPPFSIVWQRMEKRHQNHSISSNKQIPRSPLNLSNVFACKAFVIISASCYSVATCSSVTTFSSTKSLLKWWRMSIRLVLMCWMEFLEILIALRLS